jgi:hypothetical protein
VHFYSSDGLSTFQSPSNRVVASSHGYTALYKYTCQDHHNKAPLLTRPFGPGPSPCPTRARTTHMHMPARPHHHALEPTMAPARPGPEPAARPRCHEPLPLRRWTGRQGRSQARRPARRRWVAGRGPTPWTAKCTHVCELVGRGEDKGQGALTNSPETLLQYQCETWLAALAMSCHAHTCDNNNVNHHPE